ncbi:bifunctional hydroxymethylpyrimidine kinase/phosphomethylpyrimidine kinase [bacterium]|nr:bifunctional hydroxymethylpyrimidine kinase/phosphomethylpyrimidine kinase [bacterium]
MVVIGDMCLDEYILGEAYSLSPEAPVPRMKLLRRDYTPGGGANVCNCIASLGGDVIAVGVVGRDYHGEILLKLMSRNINIDNIVISPNYITTTFTKLLATKEHSPTQQLALIDEYFEGIVEEELQEELLKKARKAISEAEAVVLADYSYGVVSDAMIELVANSAPLSVGDSRDRIGYFKGIHFVVPNDNEAAQALGEKGKNDEDIKRYGRLLLEKLSAKGVIITRGAKGMMVFPKDGEIMDIPTVARQVFDVTGAGDVVTATVTLALLAGADLYQSAQLANVAAGIAVGKIGTATISPEELEEEIKSQIS